MDIKLQSLNPAVELHGRTETYENFKELIEDSDEGPKSPSENLELLKDFQSNLAQQADELSAMSAASWEDYEAKVLAEEKIDSITNPPVIQVRTAMNASLIMMSDDNPGVRTTIVASGYDGVVTQIIEEVDKETKYEMIKTELLPPTVKAFYFRMTHVVAGINESAMTVTNEEGTTVTPR